MSFKLTLKNVPTGTISAGSFISGSVFLIMPRGITEFNGETDFCNGYLQGQEFCQDVRIIETNGGSAYSTSWRLGADSFQECSSADPCYATRFFKSDLPCTPAGPTTGAVIDASHEFGVHVNFPSEGTKTQLEVLLTQGEKEEKITISDMTDGTTKPSNSNNFDLSQKVLEFSLKDFGAVVSSALQGLEWVPGQNECPTGSHASLEGATLKVRDLVIRAHKLRGHCTKCH